MVITQLVAVTVEAPSEWIAPPEPAEFEVIVQPVTVTVEAPFE